LEAVLENLNKDRYQIPDPWPYQEARRLFKEPVVTPTEELPEFKWNAPDEEGLRKFLVEENGFNNDRIMKVGYLTQPFCIAFVALAEQAN
jgi:flap endonuclease-1